MTDTAAATAQEAEGAPKPNWVWRSVILAGLTLAVPATAYFGLIEILTGARAGLSKAAAEPLAALAALGLSLLTLKVYNEKERVGLDLRGLFSVRPLGRKAALLAGFGAVDALLVWGLDLFMARYYPGYEGSGVIAKYWSGNTSWFSMAVSTILYASCEEIFLRGLVLNYIKKHAGLWTGLLVSSLLFSLMHGGRIWVSLVFIFLSGLLYGAAFELSGGLAVPCLLHGLHNFVLRAIFLLGL